MTELVSSFADTTKPLKLNYSKSLITAPTYDDYLTAYNNLKHQEDGTVDFGTGLGTETPLYKDGEAMQGYAGLVSAFAQLASLPGQLDLASIQRKGLKQNYKQAVEDSALQKTARSHLNKSMFS